MKGHGPRRGYRAGAIDGAHIYWVAPTYKQAAKIWRDLKKACQDAWSKKNETEMLIEFPGGGWIAVRSAENPDSMRGEGLDGIVYDEFCFADSYAWFKVLRPALADKKGWAIFISTPNGYNWGRELYENAAKLRGWERWSSPSWENPVLGPEEIEAARLDTSPSDFRQEWGAEFVQTEGCEWPADYLDDAIWFEGEPPTDAVCRVISNDPSKGRTDRSDYSAFCKISLDPRGVYWVDADIDRMDCSAIVDRAVSHCRDFKPDGIGFEAVAFQELLGELFVERARRQAVEVTYYDIHHGSTAKEVRIRRLTQYLSRRRIKVRDNPGGRILVDQMRQFPIGDHDDGPDSLEMGIRLCNELSRAA